MLSSTLPVRSATEENNSHFEIQRMTGSLSGPAGRSGRVEMNGNEMNWQTIAQVAGQGTTFQNLNYEFLDADLEGLDGTIYYRLKQVDYNAQTAVLTRITQVSSYLPSCMIPRRLNILIKK